MTDPKGYYSTLGVTPDATSDEIKRAYRERARRLHPDRNQAPGAKEDFQRLAEAYDALREPQRRACYDALTAEENLRHRHDYSRAIDLVQCSRCGKETAQPRYIIFFRVISFLVGTLKQPIQGIFCRDCADAEAVKASLITWVCGWWGVPWGPIYSVQALFTNLFGGVKPGDANAAILGQQAAAFFSRGRSDIARALLEEAVKLATSKRLKAELGNVLTRIGGVGEGKRLESRWGLMGGAFNLQALPIAAVAACLLFLVMDNLAHSPPRRGTSSADFAAPTLPSTVSVADIPVRDHSASPSLSQPTSPAPLTSKIYAEVIAAHVNIYGGPGVNYPVLTSLPRGRQIELGGGKLHGIWRSVKLPDGRIGYIITYYLKILDESTTMLEQSGTPLTTAVPNCPPDVQPPRNGSILTQSRVGSHQIKVTNGTGKSALVKLKDRDGREVLSFFITQHSTTVVNTVPEGDYRTYFATGIAFSTSCRRFTHDMAAQAFEGYDRFQTTIEGNYIYSSALTVTLHPVVGGNARISAIPLDQF